MAILSLIFKRAWQAQFLRHTLVHKTKNVYFFKMYKWYYYHILIFLLVSNLEKSLKSFLSRVESSLDCLSPIFHDYFPMLKRNICLQSWTKCFCSCFIWSILKAPFPWTSNKRFCLWALLSKPMLKCLYAHIHLHLWSS